MKFAFILAEKAVYPILVLCEVLGVSRSGFHAWQQRPCSPRLRSDAHLATQVAAVHKRSRGTYGSPRVHAELKAKGVRVGKKRIARLMRENGIQARCKRRFRKTTDSKHTNPIAPNIVAREFVTSAPNQVWVTDVTAIWTLEGWLFLAAILDLYSRRVVGWSTSVSNDTVLVLAALQAAVTARRPPAGLVHHSDRGSPYASADYRTALSRHGLVASMSRKGDCWDNAPTERFFRSLKHEQLNYEKFRTKEAAKLSIIDYFAFYNGKRMHSKLGYQTPLEIERKFYKKSA